MIPREVISKVRQIEIVTRNVVEDVFSGEYHSIFKGLGMEFSEVREYQPGDDVRSIDWNVTARMGQPYVKKFIEERELTVVFLVDASASGMFGSVERPEKRVRRRNLRRAGLQRHQEQRPGGPGRVHRRGREGGGPQEGPQARAAGDPRTAVLPSPQARHEYPRGGWST